MIFQQESVTDQFKRNWPVIRTVGILFLILSVLILALHLFERYRFRKGFVDSVRYYESTMRPSDPTGRYRMGHISYDESDYKLLRRSDMAKQLLSFCRGEDPDLLFWAERTLIHRYPDLPITQRYARMVMNNGDIGLERRAAAAVAIARESGDGYLSELARFYSRSKNRETRLYMALALAHLPKRKDMRIHIAGEYWRGNPMMRTFIRTELERREISSAFLDQYKSRFLGKELPEEETPKEEGEAP